MGVIEAINVMKSFGQSAAHVDAVRGINLSIAEGEMVAIVGPSGSGKSTLLSLLGAIDAPTSGKVLLEGTDIATLDDNSRTLLRRRRIGIVFQAFNLLPTLTAAENVSLPLELDGVAESKGLARRSSRRTLPGPRDGHIVRHGSAADRTHPYLISHSPWCSGWGSRCWAH